MSDRSDGTSGSTTLRAPEPIFRKSDGKNQMPPWDDLLKPEEIEALWAYVVAGEK